MKKLILGLMFLTFSVAHARGVESSGGADKYVPDVAWFLSQVPATRAVRTCYVVSDDFGVSRGTLESTLFTAFSKWNNYIAKKRIGSNDYEYATTMTLMPACDGSEDLKVYFGVTDAAVAVAKAHYVQPFGFVQKTSPDSDLWGKGFLYVASPAEIAPAPAWTSGNHLLGVLLHELGHILGCSHLDGTIMAADLSNDLSYSVESDNLDHIDRERELRGCTRCAKTYVGEATMNYGASLAGTYQTLTRHAPTGGVSATYAQDEMLEHVNEDELPEGTLLLSDAAGSISYHVLAQSRITSDEIKIPLFVTPNSAFFSYGDVYLATLIAKDGQHFQVVLTVNTEGQAFQMKLLDGKADPQVLFLSSGSNLSY